MGSSQRSRPSNIPSFLGFSYILRPFLSPQMFYELPSIRSSTIYNALHEPLVIALVLNYYIYILCVIYYLLLLILEKCNLIFVVLLCWYNKMTIKL